MLVQKGKVSKLQGLPWAAIDLVSEARIEEVVVHVSRWANANVSGAFQLLFPVKSRDLDGVDLFSPYLLVRSENLRKLISIQTIYGVSGLVRDGEGEILQIDDSFVVKVIANAKLAAMSWSDQVQHGSFVRILFGPERMLCGTVTRIHGAYATVSIELRLRRVNVRVPVRALLNLGDVPTEKRHYFYSKVIS
jgi:hypothetical protein